MTETIEQTLDLETIAAGIPVAPGMRLHLRESFFTEEIVAILEREVATLPGRPELRIPAGWWQAWKEANLDVLLRFFPVRYRTYRAIGCFPEWDVAGNVRPGWERFGRLAGRWTGPEEEEEEEAP